MHTLRCAAPPGLARTPCSTTAHLRWTQPKPQPKDSLDSTAHCSAWPPGGDKLQTTRAKGDRKSKPHHHLSLGVCHRPCMHRHHIQTTAVSPRHTAAFTRYTPGTHHRNPQTCTSDLQKCGHTRALRHTQHPTAPSAKPHARSTPHSSPKDSPHLCPVRTGYPTQTPLKCTHHTHTADTYPTNTRGMLAPTHLQHIINTHAHTRTQIPSLKGMRINPSGPNVKPCGPSSQLSAEPCLQPRPRPEGGSSPSPAALPPWPLTSSRGAQKSGTGMRW